MASSLGAKVLSFRASSRLVVSFVAPFLTTTEQDSADRGEDGRQDMVEVPADALQRHEQLAAAARSSTRTALSPPCSREGAGRATTIPARGLMREKEQVIRARAGSIRLVASLLARKERAVLCARGASRSCPRCGGEDCSLRGRQASERLQAEQRRPRLVCSAPGCSVRGRGCRELRALDARGGGGCRRSARRLVGGRGGAAAAAAAAAAGRKVRRARGRRARGNGRRKPCRALAHRVVSERERERAGASGNPSVRREGGRGSCPPGPSPVPEVLPARVACERRSALSCSCFARESEPRVLSCARSVTRLARAWLAA
jgi:hypothetical protein